MIELGASTSDTELQTLHDFVSVSIFIDHPKSLVREGKLIPSHNLDT